MDPNQLLFDLHESDYSDDFGMHAYADVEFATSRTVESMYNEEFASYEDDINFHSEMSFANQFSF
ncbi:hypothetical protein [Paenibacillus sp. KN14-4R]|uniref:hypothetical protein n=1 Tax=Paenibacillus sp. KN14-4R TaxID=3445773 RepID=UPI003FA0FE20